MGFLRFLMKSQLDICSKWSHSRIFVSGDGLWMQFASTWRRSDQLLYCLWMTILWIREWCGRSGRRSAYTRYNCQHCASFYIEETKKTMRYRLREHLTHATSSEHEHLKHCSQPWVKEVQWSVLHKQLRSWSLRSQVAISSLTNCIQSPDIHVNQMHWFLQVWRVVEPIKIDVLRAL